MSEIIVKMKSDYIKIKGGEYVCDLVRCKDCKWYQNYDGCFFSTAEIEPNGFCSYGERKDNE